MKQAVGGFLRKAWVPALIFACWWYFSSSSTSFFFPPLSRIMAVFKDSLGAGPVLGDVLVSFYRFGVSLALAYSIGILIGVALGLWPLAQRAVTPTIDFLRSVPAPAIISITVVLLGFGDLEKIAVVAFASFFPVLLNTIDGVRGVDPQQLEMASAYKLRWQDRMFRVILPAASPQIFAGLRISLTVALAVLVFAEMFTGTNGLGFFIMFAQQTYRIPEMWTGIVLLGVLGYLVNVVFLLFEHWILAWHRGWRAMAREAGAAA